MHKKSFTFGLGLGLLFVSVFFYFLYGFQKERIIVSVSQSLPTPSEISTTPSSAPTEADNTPLSDAEIIKRAEQLGMGFQPEAKETEPVSESPSPEPEATAGEVQPEVSDAPTEVIPQREEEAQPETSDVPTEMVNVVIPQGASATAVGKLLFEAGVIQDEKDFVNALIAGATTKKIGYGEYKIPVDASYSDIIKIIKR